jgi:hypothetical protein
VEPRAETKGNADQQSTSRAQSRVSVSQALDRIRKVARERKKERFTALFHHISTDLLEEAFYQLKANAVPGVDRLTWTDYEADLERKLEDLHDRAALKRPSAPPPVGLLTGMLRKRVDVVPDRRPCRVGPGNFTPSLSQNRT